jgi:predicted ATPase
VHAFPQTPADVLSFVVFEHSQMRRGPRVRDLPFFRRADASPGDGMSNFLTFVHCRVDDAWLLWEEKSAAMEEAMTVYQACIDTAVEASQPEAVAHESEAVTLGFDNALDAVRFQKNLRTALSEVTWPEELLDFGPTRSVTSEGRRVIAGLRISLGIHSGGSFRMRETGERTVFVGPAVSRAKQLAELGRGGHSLCSEEVLDELGVAGRAASECDLVDLGTQVLPKLSRESRVFALIDKQVTVPRLPSFVEEEENRTNITLERVSVIGRLEELAELARIFEGGQRLVTITGTAGVGKTELARSHGLRILEKSRKDGVSVWFCDATEATDRESFVLAFAQAVGESLPDDSSVDAWVRELGNRLDAREQTLVIIDNLEQVADDVQPVLRSWLRRSRDVSFLVTSRRPLGMEREVQFDLGPLDTADAVRFLELRIQRVQRGFSIARETRDDAERLVHILGRIPLAIELVAARAPLFTITKLCERLENDLSLLSPGDGGGGRHDTLLSAIQWSWNLLESDEKEVMRQCAVFAGGFAIEDAEHVVELDGEGRSVVEVLEAIRQHSLIRSDRPPEFPDETRLYFYVTVREFLRAQTDATVDRALHGRHATHFCQQGEAWAGRAGRPLTPESRRRLVMNRDNLMRAHNNALELEGDLAAKLALIFEPLCHVELPGEVYLDILDRTLEQSRSSGPGMQAIRLARGTLRTELGLTRLALDDLRSSGDAEDVDRDVRVECWIARSDVEARLGRPKEADSAAERAVDIAMEGTPERPATISAAYACAALAERLSLSSMHERAADQLGAAMEIVGGLSVAIPARVLSRQAAALIAKGELDRAAEFLDESLEAKGDTRRPVDRDRDRVERAMLAMARQRDDSRADLRSWLERRETGLLAHHRARAFCTVGVFALFADRPREGWERFRLGRSELSRPDFPVLAHKLLAWESIAGLLMGGREEISDDLDRAEFPPAEQAFLASLEAFRLLSDARVCAEDERLGPARQHIHDAELAADRVAEAASSGASLDGRVALRLIRHAMAGFQEQFGLGEASSQATMDAMLVEETARWFKLPDEDEVDITRRGPARRILHALADSHIRDAGTPMTLDDIIDAGWPDEQLLPEAGANRAYVTISTLRGLGLRDHIVTTDDGYMFDPSLAVEWAGD